LSRFRDHFSGHAREYSLSRPRYPRELFHWLALQVDRHDLAWDCATGNGQAAIGLVDEFRRVIASDASLDQVALAQRVAGIDYLVALSSVPSLASTGVNLVTVAQALHWFDLEPFYQEVRRVLAPGGVFAAWTYALLRSSPELNRLIDRFADETVGGFWPPPRRHVDARYADLDFPFEEIRSPEFLMRVDWTLDELIAYLETWSSVRRFWSARGFSPVADLEPELAAVWGPRDEPREILWRLSIRVGRL